RVLTAADGEAGLAAVAAVRPDLVVLDVMMPRMNGFQTLRAVRATPESAGLPVIMLTSKDQPADQFWAEEVGASAYLTKPVEIPLLLDTIAARIGAP
ncbi:MAG TPA: response regulator, partial [Gemmatimonadales bacterium]|nr:response regulator [Gemmatimonadales bacterium]